jgi:hypothetical protein
LIGANGKVEILGHSRSIEESKLQSRATFQNPATPRRGRESGRYSVENHPATKSAEIHARAVGLLLQAYFKPAGERSATASL